MGRITRLAAVALVGPLLLAAVPANAASTKPTVRTGQLPSVAEVTTVFPAFAGGSRNTLRATPETVNGLGDCGNWRVVLRAPTGRWAYYETAGGDSPFFSGGEDPGVFTYRYSSTKKARKAMGRLTGWIGRCVGDHSVDGITWTVEAPRVARVGTRTVAMTELRTSPNVLTGTSVAGEVHLAARTGRYLTISIVQAEDRIPDLTRATRLARVSLKALR